MQVQMGDLPHGPVVKISPSSTGDVGQSLVREPRSHMLRGQKAKQNKT